MIGNRQVILKAGLVAAALLWGISPRASSSQDQHKTPVGASPSRLSQWRPRGASKGDRYVGQEACARCHTDIAASYANSAMSRALEPGAESRVLRAHPLLTFRSGPYTYRIERQGQQSIYSVSDGERTVSVPILWGFGEGVGGQTFVFQHEGAFYESRVSYYTEIKGLDYTIGAPRRSATSLNEALGRVMTRADTLDCFGCHSTAAAADRS